MSNFRPTPNRFADHTGERPSTGVRQSPVSQQKSFIPKFRSLSQPPSVSAMEPSPDTQYEAPNTLEDDKFADEIKNSLLENEMFSDPNMTDEFKDCLESVKLELDSSSAADLDNLQMGTETAEEILKNLKIPDEIELERPATPIESPQPQASSCAMPRPTAKTSAPFRTMSRKNSSSGIPISTSMPGKMTGNRSFVPAPKAIPRRIGAPPSMLAATKRQGTSGSVSNTNRNMSPSAATTVKRNWDMFITKKKRYDFLRKDIQDKRKPMVELYHTLQELKKKLEEGGKHMSEVEPMLHIEECGAGAPLKPTQVEVEAPLVEPTIDIKVLNDVKKAVEEIRLTSVELCKNMLEKRNDMITTFENIAQKETSIASECLIQELEAHKNENAALEAFLKKTIFDQKSELCDMIDKLTILSSKQSEEDVPDNLQQQLQDLKDNANKIKQLERQLGDAHIEMRALQEASAVGQECGDALRHENDKLKLKISSLEKLIDTERKRASHELERFKSAESSTKSLKAKIKELETVKQQNEQKVAQLHQDLRSAQNKQKLNERNYEKEIADLNKSRNLDKSVIERLNRDKSTFEARFTNVKETLDALKIDCDDKEKEHRVQMEFVRKECDVQTNTVGQMKLECEKLRHELNTLQTHAKQTTDLLKSREENRAKSLATEKECELQVEVVAQRAAIRGLQEKVDASATEKMRFIETIEKMSGDSNDQRKEILKTLIKKEEELTEVHQKLKKREEELLSKSMDNQTMKSKIKHLEEHVTILKRADDKDLKNIIKEGRSKLEEAIMKSVQNETKMIKYEHDLALKMKVITHLENNLKLRDGLINLLKAKKLEMVHENESLTKYADEIRSFVVEAKEEQQQKTDIISQLERALNTKVEEIHRLQLHIQRLEDQLSLTNAKRYKLQDTVCSMEKELQAVKDDADTRRGNKFLKPKQRRRCEN